MNQAVPAAPNLAREIFDDIAMIGLALVSVGLLVFEVVADHSPAQLRTLEVADTVIALIFLTEFVYNLVRAPNRAAWLRGHWWELLASIPINHGTAQLLRGLRLLRVFRLMRLLRLVRFVVRFKVMLQVAGEFAEQTYLIYIATIGGVVLASGALGFHYMEAGANPNVHSLWDSFWWTVVTVTTVGYGDIYPVTTGGRILAIFLMLGGIATMGAITGAIAAYFIKRSKEC